MGLVSWFYILVSMSTRLDQTDLKQINECLRRDSVGSSLTRSSDEDTLVAEESGQNSKLRVEFVDSKLGNFKKLQIVVTDGDCDSDEYNIVTMRDSKKDSGFGSQGILKLDKFKVSI